MRESVAKVTITFGLTKKIMDNEQKDYIDCFVPLVADLILRKGITSIDVSKIHEFKDLFAEDYKITIPFQPMQVILDRCKNKFKIISRAGQHLRVDFEECSKYDLHVERLNFTRKSEKFIENLLEYSLQKYPEFKFKNDVEEIFMKFLEENDYNLLFFAENESFVKSEKIVEDSEKYIFAEYVVHSYNSCREDFEYVVEVFLGHTISNTLLLTDTSYECLNLALKKIFFDTPIILRALGYSEPSYSETYKNFIIELKKLGATIYIFRHTLDEIRDLLTSSVIWLDPINTIRYDPEKASITTQFLVQSNYSKLNLEVNIEKLEETIEDVLGIKIIEKPTIGEENKQYLISEENLTQLIESHYKSTNRNFDTTMYNIRTQRDVDSISAIYLLRNGKRCNSMKDVDYCFITTNSALVYSNKLYNVNNNCSDKEVLACLTDTFLGTLIWVNSPKLLEKTISMKILGHLTSSIRPNSKSESKLRYYAQTLRNSEQISENDFLLLMSSYLTKDYLSQHILGDMNNLTSQTALEILEDIKNSVSIPFKSEIERLTETNSHQKVQYENKISIIETTYTNEIEDLKSKLNDKIVEEKLYEENKRIKKEEDNKRSQRAHERIEQDIIKNVHFYKIILFVLITILSIAIYLVLNKNALLYALVSCVIGNGWTFFYSEKIIEKRVRKNVERRYQDFINVENQ